MLYPQESQDTLWSIINSTIDAFLKGSSEK